MIDYLQHFEILVKCAGESEHFNGIFLQHLNIYLFSKIFQKVKIVKFR